MDAIVTERMSKGRRLRALTRLLEYALAESQELGLADLDILLGAAVLAIGDALGNAQVFWPRTEASRRRSRSKP
jgi:hypothetical protein